jgi:hypothetical protein
MPIKQYVWRVRCFFINPVGIVNMISIKYYKMYMISIKYYKIIILLINMDHVSMHLRTQ